MIALLTVSNPMEVHVFSDSPIAIPTIEKSWRLFKIGWFTL